MTVHTFLACDACNQLGIRMVEQRSGGHRDIRRGRRSTDGRAWFEGSESDAESHGWLVLQDGRHVCPDCRKRGLHERLTA